ncbi:hypothetical protein [Amycolatopsis arida]|uniref:hypothetical protein n=1 Tax=Amycolatopsis arida TaxID=587909 RepID=UPI000A71C992|nr:hypothetical protein [Amycolatopsis arida]
MSSPASTDRPTEGPELLVDVPPGFVGLPLRGSAEDNAAAIAGLASDLAPHAGDQAAELPRHLTWLAQLLAEGSVRLYGRFAVSDTSLAELALAVVPLRAEDDTGPAAVRRNRHAAVEELRRHYLERHPGADARIVPLGLGPAMVAVTAGEYRLPPQATRTGQATVLPQLRAEFQLPVPAGTHLIVLVVTGRDEETWQAVLTAAMRVANSIRLEPGTE